MFGFDFVFGVFVICFNSAVDSFVEIFGGLLVVYYFIVLCLLWWLFGVGLRRLRFGFL